MRGGVGAILQRAHNVAPRLLSSSTSLPWGSLLDDQVAFSYFRSLSSYQSYVARSSLFSELHGRNSQCFPYDGVRRISKTSVVCMGRRSCKIAGRKEAQNAKKMKIYSKIGKEVVSAIKKGGPNVTSNVTLAALLEKAKELDVPKEILDRNIKRASEKGQDAYIEKIYEVYGFGGVCMVVEVLTDKITRSVAAVRSVVRDCGGKMADPGSVLFKFKRARVVNVKVSEADKDQLLSIALDAGAEDVIEPPLYDDDDFHDADPSEDNSDSVYKVVASSDNYAEILSKLREEGINFETDNGTELLPISAVEVDDEAAEMNKDLMSKLLELEDVDAVYTDQK